MPPWAFTYSTIAAICLVWSASGSWLESPPIASANGPTVATSIQPMPNCMVVSVTPCELPSVFSAGASDAGAPWPGAGEAPPCVPGCWAAGAGPVAVPAPVPPLAEDWLACPVGREPVTGAGDAPEGDVVVGCPD